MILQDISFLLNKCRKTSEKLVMGAKKGWLFCAYINQVFGGVHILQLGATPVQKIKNSKVYIF